MSNALVSLFGNTFEGTANLPAHLFAADGSATAQLLGGLGGEGRNRIGLKGARFRLVHAGQEVAVKDESYLDVVILGANAAVSRTYYAGKYDQTKKEKPTCFSPDGVAPHKDSVTPQSTKCATCPQNEKGSKIYEDGTKGRACGFSKRLAVTLPGDPDQTVYQLDVKALSIFGDGMPAKRLYTLAEYTKLLASQNFNVTALVTRVSFDTDVSVPKLYFTPQAPIVDASVAANMQKLAKSKETQKLLEVTPDSVDLTGEVDAPEPFAQPATVKPAAVAAPKPAPVADVVAPEPEVIPAEPKPAKVKAAPVAAPVAAAPMEEDLAGLLDDLV